MTQIKVIKPDMGESIEEKLRKVNATNQPIDSVSPMIYTPKAEGVKPEYDIRTDRFDIAIDAADKFAASDAAHNTENAQINENEKQNEN